VQGIEDLLDYGILDIIMPEVAALAHDRAARHKNLWEHTLTVMDNTTITPEIEKAIRDVSEKTGIDFSKLRTMIH
jgi:hypothetical protein